MGKTNRRKRTFDDIHVGKAGVLHRPGGAMYDKRTKRKKTRATQKREAYRGQED